MSATPRLLEITEALTEAGIAFLIMGGHAVRHYGVDRNTFDFDFNVLSLPDLIRSKETERDDDWADVRLLEEILDGRHLAGATDAAGRVRALSQLRSRRGFERAEVDHLFAGAAELSDAIKLASHPVTCAYLLPLVHKAGLPSPSLPLDRAVETVLCQVAPSSARHRRSRSRATGLSTCCQSSRPSR